MDAFIARQPIFNKKERVVAYELLYRDSFENYYKGNDEDKATCNVIANVFSLVGVDKITWGKKAFINFPKNLITDDVIPMLPKDVVIEILETVEPTPRVVNACRYLKECGYTLALDDFIFDKKYIELLDLADIVKVDFKMARYEKKFILNNTKNNNIKFLAEKVETQEDYNKAKNLGYDLFQGYFFSKPTIVSAKDIPKEKLIYVEILSELSKKNVDIVKLKSLIIKDLSIIYKFLKLINSSMYGLKSKIISPHQAITYLGEIESCKWLYVIVLGSMGSYRSSEIVRASIVRAKFCERIGSKLYPDDLEKQYNFFIVGMLSMLDVILERNMESLLGELFLEKDVREALIGKGNKYREVLDLIISYERARWDECTEFSKKLNINISAVVKEYIFALNWANII
ncbi:EAL and HDOD domain-containing protein [Clostridium coskatii]|uniref:EAL domain protein n=1 Tax=Clostridium coskatii TaxID=1705578 RepID=A0A162LIM3_9CLOT|nr:HDOD domain-containing protein [Clostridium coskatii]OAA93986.1 EAL domain protein [Clostridium coskatii]OBR90195.1 EAL domain protein [Clostridium coskatii]